MTNNYYYNGQRNNYQPIFYCFFTWFILYVYKDLSLKRTFSYQEESARLLVQKLQGDGKGDGQEQGAVRDPVM